jgi:hypothetical protein
VPKFGKETENNEIIKYTSMGKTFLQNRNSERTAALFPKWLTADSERNRLHSNLHIYLSNKSKTLTTNPKVRLFLGYVLKFSCSLGDSF